MHVIITNKKKKTSISFYSFVLFWAVSIVNRMPFLRTFIKIELYKLSAILDYKAYYIYSSRIHTNVFTHMHYCPILFHPNSHIPLLLLTSTQEVCNLASMFGIWKKQQGIVLTPNTSSHSFLQWIKIWRKTQPFEFFACLLIFIVLVSLLNFFVIFFFAEA